MDYRVLVTCVNGNHACHLYKNIKEKLGNSLYLLGVDANLPGNIHYFLDNFVQCPLGDSPHYADFILDLCIKEDINLIIPTSDEEAFALSKEKKNFDEKNIQIACVDHSLIKIFSNKECTYQELEKRGLPAPKWQIANTKEDLIQVIKTYQKNKEELVIKPSQSRGGRNIITLFLDESESGVEEIERELRMSFSTFLQNYADFYRELFPVVVQERLLEPVFDLDMLAWEGASICVIPRKRVQSTNPNAGHKIVKDKNLEDLGKKIIKSFQLSWLYDCDVMFDRNRHPKIIEINPRQSGSLSVSVEAGVPLIEMILELHKGSIPSSPKVPFGSIVIPYTALAKVPQ